MKRTLLLLAVLEAGCADADRSDSPTRTGTVGTPSQRGSENQLGDPSQVNVNRINTMPQDGENAFATTLPRQRASDLDKLQFIVRGGRPSIVTGRRVLSFATVLAFPAAEPLGSLLARVRKTLFHRRTTHAIGVSAITITHSAALLR